MHSTYSHDGKLSISQLRAIGLDKGWDFMFLSDHYEDLNAHIYKDLVADCIANSDEKLQIIPGYEKNWGYDICAFGVYYWDEISDLGQWSKHHHQNGAMLCLMHPSKYNFNIPQKFLEHINAIEVWNTKWPYDGRLFPSPQSFKLLNAKIVGIAGQDIHKLSDVTSVINVVNTNDSLFREILNHVSEGNFVVRGVFGEMLHLKSQTFNNFLIFYQFVRRGTMYGFYKIWRLRKKIFGHA